MYKKISTVIITVAVLSFASALCAAENGKRAVSKSPYAVSTSAGRMKKGKRMIIAEEKGANAAAKTRTKEVKAKTKADAKAAREKSAAEAASVEKDAAYNPDMR